MQVLFLGTGAGMPSKQRNTSALALKLHEERGAIWLFDCGEAVQHQILETTIKPRKIEKIFITHMHGDHIFGLPGLLGSRSFQGGDEPLDLYGPKELKEYIEMTLRLSRTHLTYPIRFHEVTEGVIFEDKTMTVEAGLLEHVIPTYGYRIEQKPLLPKLDMNKAKQLGVPKGPLLAKLKSGETVELEDGRKIESSAVTEPAEPGFTVTILGDTQYCSKSEHLAQDADLVVHEATFDGETEKLAKDYGHSTILDAATVASRAQAQKLIVNHVSARFMPEHEKELLKNMRKVHEDSEIAHDFDEFDWVKKERKMVKIAGH
ncbi:ribonuclease Z [Planococcus maritimus]|uniref:ribonuclease Z n=1 Tax=Planococcus maritimus TaxID=192421 RepID=UPI00079A0D92|nr:ribonuclease Z [Planococcus maritimus]KYG70933.1 ribonuclease Z [Planococcus maritimus]